jgi:hypothetical protein
MRRPGDPRARLYRQPAEPMSRAVRLLGIASMLALFVVLAFLASPSFWTHLVW